MELFMKSIQSQYTTKSEQRPVFRQWGVALTLLAFTSTLFAACAVSFPHFKRSRDVTVAFETGDIRSDHRYYAGGPKAKPNAVVAIHRDYTLESGKWREIQVDREALVDLIRKVGFVSGAVEKKGRMPNGAYIIGPGGEQLGIWYSVYDYSIVRMVSPTSISLTDPPSTLPMGTTSEGLRS
jgi:hypothetical protein